MIFSFFLKRTLPECIFYAANIYYTPYLFRSHTKNRNNNSWIDGMFSLAISGVRELLQIDVLRDMFWFRTSRLTAQAILHIVVSDKALFRTS
jgi:hypothetical protein